MFDGGAACIVSGDLHREAEVLIMSVDVVKDFTSSLAVSFDMCHYESIPMHYSRS